MHEQYVPCPLPSLMHESECLSDFKREKLEREARKNWDLFYKRNSTHFFKDRHWVTREFPELLQAVSSLDSKRPVLLEAGCGVGNTLFPLLEENPNLFVYACDFSPRAVEHVKAHPAYRENHCTVFQCDLTTDQLTEKIAEDSVDLVSLIFVLSAISPDKMKDALVNIRRVLKVGGCAILRDYGYGDHAMLRFGRGHKISECFYMRQDGTRAYYFSLEKLAALATEVGFEVLENQFIEKETVNRKEGISVPRLFIQSRLAKI